MELTTEELRAELEALRKELQDQQEGALLYLAAVVNAAAGVGNEMRLSNGDMMDATNLVLERGDLPDGGLALKVTRSA